MMDVVHSEYSSVLQRVGVCLLGLLCFISVIAATRDNKTGGSGLQASQSFSAGNGLFEIAALTTLIGSSTAEFLALGNNGAIGLPWAAMSAFGCISVVKSCATGASPGWLRETLGIRSATSDYTLGLSFDLIRNFRGASKIRRNKMDAVGISCKSVSYTPSLTITADHLLEQSSPQTSSGGARRRWRPVWQDVYAFDKETAELLIFVPASPPNNHPRVVTHNFDYEEPWKFDAYDWVALLSSLIKSSEMYVLYRFANLSLVCSSNAAWLYFFLAAIFLQFRYTLQMRRGQQAKNGNHELNVLTGQLPTTLRPGGERKIFLGAPENYHHSTSWKVTWGCGLLISIPSVVMTYVCLSRLDNSIVYIWALFQAGWLLLRLVFSHFAEAVNTTGRRLTTEHEWQTLTDPMKLGVLELTLALAKYQMHFHPRGHYCYSEDLLSPQTLIDLLAQVNYQLQPSFPLESTTQPGNVVNISITSVVGDTVLASATWVVGCSKLRGIDLYDTCIVFINSCGRNFAIPSTRVQANIVPGESRHNIENVPVFPVRPRGAGNIGVGLSWWYWIPCGDGVWLQTYTDNMKILGKREAQVVTDEQVTQRLSVGDLQISLTNVEGVREATTLAMQTAHTLLQLVPPTEAPTES